MKKKSRERGAATLVEYAIVLPITLGIIAILVFVGFTMHQKAVMEAATERAAIIIARSLTDQNYLDIVKISTKTDATDAYEIKIGDGVIKTAPYRYLFVSSGTIPCSEESVADLITKNQIFFARIPAVTVERKGGILPRAIVSAEQEYDLPKIFPGLDLPPAISIHTESVVYLNQPAELIRNADFAIDLLKDVVKPIVEKLKSVIDKITFFKKKT